MAPRVVVISGGSAGIGRATARRFARQGSAVAVLARGDDGLRGTVADIEAAGAQGLGIAVDVADAEGVERAAQRIERELGEIEVWVNCAMLTVFSPVGELAAEEIRRVTEVTYLGTVHGTQAALSRMQARQRGTIVQVGSALAYRAIPLQAAYCAAKFAIRGFTDALRCELLHQRSPIHVCMVQLAAFNTPQFDWARSRLGGAAPRPLPPVYQPEMAAEAICWAARQRRREVWVGFSAIKTIVGGMLLPALADRLAARQAWGGQFDRQAEVRDQPGGGNLFSPRPDDRGAHGRFDREARGRSVALTIVKHRGVVLAISALLLIGVVAVLCGIR